MRIQKLHIEDYRNIKDLDLDLSSQNGLSVFIGNNGCGKSNILEAVVAIFASQFDSSDSFKPDFKYTLEYTSEDAHDVAISNIGTRIQIDNQPKTKKQLQPYLPKNIIACYSGETNRLEEEYFKPFRRRFVSNRLHNKHADLKLLFVNKDLWNISLLTLFLHDSTYVDIHTFLEQTLNISRIENVRFKLLHKANIQANEAQQLLNAIAPKGEKDVSISFADLKRKIEQIGFAPKEVFMAFYVGMYAQIFKTIEITVYSNTDSTFDAKLLSEGEKKLLSIFTMLEVLGDESSLMLYDEPDSQIHISRKESIKLLIEKYLNRQHLLSTHSPSLAKSFIESNHHLCCLRRNREGAIERIDNDKYELIADLTDGQWNLSEQNVFLASTKPITLLLEGKTDKIHISAAFKALKNDYPALDFDIFHFGGANNIPQFIVGLKTCEVDFSGRKIIAIFDNDKEGRNCCNQTQVKYVQGKTNKCGLYAITLPSEKDATIENLYDQSKYDQAFKDVVAKTSFKGLVSDYAKNITEQAKIEMSNTVDKFLSSDFSGFKPLFDIIQEINKL